MGRFRNFGPLPISGTDEDGNLKFDVWMEYVTTNFDQRDRGPRHVITLIAQDLVSAPSSQAFVERLFSVCGMPIVGRRNRMDKSLSIRG